MNNRSVAHMHDHWWLAVIAEQRRDEMMSEILKWWANVVHLEHNFFQKMDRIRTQIPVIFLINPLEMTVYVARIWDPERDCEIRSVWHDVMSWHDPNKMDPTAVQLFSETGPRFPFVSLRN